MNGQELGRLIGRIRKEKNIPAEKLCNGVCTQTVLQRLETEEQVPDMMILERLLSRMGISANKVEILLQYQEYENYALQMQIEQALDKHDYEDAEKLLEKYRGQEREQHPVKRQYCRKIEAVLDVEREADARKTAEKLLETLRITLPGFSTDRIDKYLLSEEEWILFFMWLEQEMAAGGQETGSECLKILRYVEKRDWDEEMSVRLYPKIVWLYTQQKNVEETEKAELCSKVLRMLIKGGILLDFAPFLNLRKNVLHTKAAEEENEVLKWAYEIEGLAYPDTKIRMWKTFRQNDMFLMSETVRMERRALGKSQEKLASDTGVDSKTLSRIETGVHMPKPATFTKIARELPACRNQHTTAVAVDDFELLELKREIAREMTLLHLNKAQALFDLLCRQISMEEKKNRQYVLFIQTLLKYRKKETDREKALKSAVEAFEQTRPFDIEKISRVVLSENESNTANFIAQMYRELGDEKKAIEILESVLSGYDRSRLPESCHYRAITVILLKLSYYCETSNLFEKAAAYCERGLRLQFECHRVNMLGYFLMQKYYIRERTGAEGKDRRAFYINLYKFNRLLNDEGGEQDTKRAYEKRYGNMPEC